MKCCVKIVTILRSLEVVTIFNDRRVVFLERIGIKLIPDENYVWDGREFYFTFRGEERVDESREVRVWRIFQADIVTFFNGN